MFKRLRFRFSVIFVGLAVGPLLLVAVFLTRHSIVFLEQQSQALLREISISVGNEIRTFLEDRAYHLALSHKLYAMELLNPEKQGKILNNILFDQQDYQDLVLLNPKGQELMRLSRSFTFFDEDMQNRETHEVFRFPATHRSPYFSSVRFDKKIQEPLVTISVPLVDLRNGKLAYVLAANLRFKKIWDLLANIEITGKGVVYVVDQTNMVVAHPNPSVVLRNTTVNLPEVTGRAKGLNGTDVILTWDLLKFGNQNLKVVAEQPVSQAFVLMTKHFRVALIVTSLAILVAIFFAVLAIRHFVKPLESLAIAARAISIGDYSQNIEVTGQDEVGTLASAFNEMSQDLEKYNSKMEELIRMRTEELEQSLTKVKQLSGLLPICASCKKIRDDKGYWNQIESYLVEHSEAEFSHSVCPDCSKKLLAELDKYDSQKKD